MKEYWWFWFIGANPVRYICAETTDQFPDGAGLRIVFEVQTGKFYNYWDEADLRDDLFTAIRSIEAAAGAYASRHKRQAATFDVLRVNGWIYVSSELMEDWEFIPVHDRNRLVSVHAVKLVDEEGDEFNLINYYTDSNEFEVLLIDDPDSKEIMRAMPEILDGIFYYEAENFEKPGSIILDPNHEIWDKYSIGIFKLPGNYQIRFQRRGDRTQNLDEIVRFILPFGRFAGGEFPITDLGDIMGSFAEIYRCTEGGLHFFLDDIQGLIDERYLVYSERVLSRWEFFFSPMMSGFSDRYQSDCGIGAVSKQFNDDYAFHLASMDLFVANGNQGVFSTAKVTNPEIRPLVDATLDVMNGAIQYNSVHEEDAASVEELIEKGYTEIDSVVHSEWGFSIIGSNPIGGIEAISTEEMNGEAGHVFRLVLKNGTFEGYGVDNEE
ncbi:MAG: hypothetical protein HN757_01755, partial [Calditrichaeota bacterium]|nr:hypothetical protein [Calditrichota bacterium]